MSDTGRKDLTSQVKEGVTADSQKSPLDKASETVTDAGDKVASAVQPGDSKSTTQKLSDSTSSGTNDTEGAAKGYLAQAQDMASSALNTASETATNIANSITGEKK